MQDYRLQGLVAEKYILTKLRAEDYKVVKLVRQVKSKFDNKYYNQLNVQFLKNIIAKEYMEDIEELINFLKQNITGLPDFICLKDGELSFIEAKSNTSELIPSQEKTFQILRKHGYKVDIRRVNVNLEINET